MVLQPFVVIVSMINKRKRELSNPKRIAFIKMLGGGSLVVAYPALLAIRRRFPDAKMIAIGTQSVKPFADLIGIFDEFILIRDASLYLLVSDILRFVVKVALVDICVDLEVHSRLTAILGVLLLAKSRIGFYTGLPLWLKGIYTHTLYFNNNRGIYFFYDQIANLLGAPIPSYNECSELFSNMLPRVPALPTGEAVVRIGIAAGCSDLIQERMFYPSEWVTILANKLAISPDAEFHFLGES